MIEIACSNEYPYRFIVALVKHYTARGISRRLPCILIRCIRIPRKVNASGNQDFNNLAEQRIDNKSRLS
jgi:hypothetical protein